MNLSGHPRKDRVPYLTVSHALIITTIVIGSFIDTGYLLSRDGFPGFTSSNQWDDDDVRLFSIGPDRTIGHLDGC